MQLPGNARSIAQRCACRPGCLAWLRPDDQTVQTAAGLVLVAHLTAQLGVPNVRPETNEGRTA
jgi:hypothetical protein